MNCECIRGSVLRSVGGIMALLGAVVLVFLTFAGCSHGPLRDTCPPAPKCPSTYIEELRGSQDAADRLEDALRDANRRAQATDCIQAFEGYQRKGR